MRCFGTEHVHAESNVANPMSGTELQYARNLAPEQTVEVVRDHEGGAWAAVGIRCPFGALVQGKRRRGMRTRVGR
jgi:hypothetical protein